MARRIGLRGFVAGLATVIGLTACGADGAAQRDARRALLSDVENWVYIIDVNLDDDVVNQIADSDHDLVVLDFIESEAQNTDYPTAETVATLHDAENPKVVLAYIDIGEAEDYRSYWQNGWEIGDPDWILGADPDGWEGNYPVAFWRDNWQSIWLGDGQIAEIAAAGFDGIYLDWVEAYEDENVTAAAADEGVDPVDAMVEWVARLAAAGREADPDFLVIGQNAAELAVDSPEYREVVDGIAQEQVFFDGGADNDPPGDCPLPETEADIETDGYVESLSLECRRLYEDFPDSTLHVSSEWYIDDLVAIQESGVPVFTVDYAQAPENAAYASETSRGLDFVPFVTVRSLDVFVAPDN